MPSLEINLWNFIDKKDLKQDDKIFFSSRFSPTYKHAMIFFLTISKRDIMRCQLYFKNKKFSTWPGDCLRSYCHRWHLCHTAKTSRIIIVLVVSHRSYEFVRQYARNLMAWRVNVKNYRVFSKGNPFPCLLWKPNSGTRIRIFRQDYSSNPLGAFNLGIESPLSRINFNKIANGVLRIVRN